MISNFKNGIFGILAYTYWSLTKNQDHHKNCGIIGVISKENNAQTAIANGISLLQNRGYDSAGIASLKKLNNLLFLTKFAKNNDLNIDCIQKVINSCCNFHKGSYLGIGHTRWATCGAQTDQNAHPHHDTEKRIVLVHNGTLSNFKQIRNTLLSQNIPLLSQTDSELIAHLINQQLKNCQSLQEAVQIVTKNKLNGLWALVIIDTKNPYKLVATTNGNSLLVGLSQHNIYIASEKIAFEQYCDQFIEIKENQIISLSLDTFADFKQKMKKQNRINIIKQFQQIMIKPIHPFKSFFEQQINDQPQSIKRALNLNHTTLPKNNLYYPIYGMQIYSEQIKNYNNCILLGCGSSSIANSYGTHIFRKLKAFEITQQFDGSVFTQDCLTHNTLFILTSQSGESKDLLNSLKIINKYQKKSLKFGIVNVVGSALARMVDFNIFINAKRQVAVAASKSFSAQTIMLICLGIWISHMKQKNNQQYRRKLVKQLIQLHIKFQQVLNSYKKQIRTAALLLRTKKSFYTLAKGSSLALAKQLALKIKQLNYIHCQAFDASQMKHGPIALIDSSHFKETAIVLFIFDDQYLQVLKVTLDQMNSRQALIIVITNCSEKLIIDKIDLIFQVNVKGYLANLSSIPIIQLLTLELCYCLNTNPDKPRNLAKTVTV